MNNLIFLNKIYIYILVLLIAACKKEDLSPTCYITYPHDGDEFELGYYVNISVDAIAKDGIISEVRFYIDSIGISSSTTFPYSYSWFLNYDERIGDHIIKVVAIDNSGRTATDECKISIVGIPTVTTIEVNSITQIAAETVGNITNDGGKPITECGVCWSTSQNPSIYDSCTIDNNNNGTFISSIIGLIPNTIYYVRSYATNSLGISYGNVISFRTLLYTSTVIDYDGNEYNTVKIGEQWWMAENLMTTHYSDGIAIPFIEDTLSWAKLTSTHSAYCYYDYSITNRDVYGALYNWAAAINYSNSNDNKPNITQGVCPLGWHLPSDSEWKELEIFLGMKQYDADRPGNRGTDEGGKLKETGIDHWNDPNTGATNFSGFTALPGGYQWDSGSSKYLGSIGYFWTSTESLSMTTSFFRSLGYNSEQIYRSDYPQVYGMSVRCIKNY